MNGEEQEQQAPMYYPPPNQVTEGLLKYQLSNEQLLEEIEHNLLGECQVYKDGQVKWVKKDGVVPLLNKMGVNNIMMVLRSTLSKIFPLSDLEKEDICNITDAVCDTISKLIRMHHKEWGIDGNGFKASAIMRIVEHPVYGSLRRGYLGSFQRGLRSSTQILETNTIRQDPRMQQGGQVPQKRGFLGFFKGKG